MASLPLMESTLRLVSLVTQFSGKMAVFTRCCMKTSCCGSIFMSGGVGDVAKARKGNEKQCFLAYQNVLGKWTALVNCYIFNKIFD